MPSKQEKTATERTLELFPGMPLLSVVPTTASEAADGVARIAAHTSNRLRLLAERSRLRCHGDGVPVTAVDVAELHRELRAACLAAEAMAQTFLFELGGRL